MAPARRAKCPRRSARRPSRPSARMIRVPLREGRTLHHDVHRPLRRRRVVLRAAVPGTGIIAGGPMRAIFEALGVAGRGRQVGRHLQPAQHDQGGVRRAHNSTSPRSVAARRGKKVERHPRPPRARWQAEVEGVRAMAEKPRQIRRSPRSAARSAASTASARTLMALGAQPDASQPRARGYAGGARHDRQGPPPGAGRGRAG